MKPSWLPEDCIWAGPTKKNDSKLASQMSAQRFLRNEKKVLRAAYTFAGFDPEVYVCATKSLKKRTTTRECPYRLPLLPLTQQPPAAASTTTPSVAPGTIAPAAALNVAASASTTAPVAASATATVAASATAPVAANVFLYIFVCTFI